MTEDVDPFDELKKYRAVVLGNSGTVSKGRSSSTSVKSSEPKDRSPRDDLILPKSGLARIPAERWLIIAFALIFVILFIYLPRFSVYWSQYGVLIIFGLIFIVIGEVFFYIKFNLSHEAAVEKKRRNDVEMEKRIIRKNLESKRADELKILDEKERGYLLDKWVEEEYSISMWVEKEYLKYLKGEKTILSSDVKE